MKILALVASQDSTVAVSYTHLDVYKRQGMWVCTLPDRCVLVQSFEQACD